MPDRKVAIGVDYGTNSCRALIVDLADGAELGSAVWDYEGGEAGILLDHRDPHLARQNPADYRKGFVETVRKSLAESGVEPTAVVGIGVDTTGSTPLPIDASGEPLGCLPEFRDEPAAMAWLWKDHTGAAEAAEITETAKKMGVPYLAKCGGAYSSEWFWAKILHCKRVAPKVFDAAHSWIELQDFVPAWITGNAATPPRGACAAGHKAMFHRDWGGLPSKEFLAALDPALAPLRDRLYTEVKTSDQKAGALTTEVAKATGVPSGTAVAVGAFDAHLGAVGSGVKPGTIVKIMGTSTCDIMVGGDDTPDIPGVCGVVPGSVIPGYIGIEAGQSAVGDLFNWGASKLSDGSHERLQSEAARLKPGESGLLALDWNNGNRTILVDQLLTGLLVGQTLHTTAADIYRSLVEATAFGARAIIERIEQYGVPIKEIVVCGGIAEKSPLAMQIYADVCARPIKISRSAQTCALGAAIAGAVAGGGHRDFLSAIQTMTGVKATVYTPETRSAAVYERLYRLYMDLHDAFGKTGKHPDVSEVMKELLRIRKEVTA